MNALERRALPLGELLAEGGEGRVFEVVPGAAGAGRPCVYKELRHPRPLPELGPLIAFPGELASLDPWLSARALSSSAWPLSAVVGDDPELALGSLLPRAPAQFWVRHRDGTNRLATLSYLANDPDRIAVAYGVTTPPPGAPERVAIVYALARLLEAWQRDPPAARVAHGDLSAKNVLWSLIPAPAVYVLDCDGATVLSGDESPSEDESLSGDDGASGAGLSDRGLSDGGLSDGGLSDGGLSDGGLSGGGFSGGGFSGGGLSDGGLAVGAGRPRATTPNWDDPALPAGDRPTESSDRYLLAITFLRVVGAAHFPLQSRQRTGAHVNVDLELPRSWRKYPDMPGLWGLCERSLSLVNYADRPPPSEWVAELEELLAVQSGTRLAAAVREAQGDERPGRVTAAPDVRKVRNLPQVPQVPDVPRVPDVTVPDIVVRPVLRHRPPPTWRLIGAAPLDPGADPATVSQAAGGSAAIGSASIAPRKLARQVLAMWGGAHSAAARLARSPGRRRYGVRRLAGVLVLDLAAACVGVFVIAMIVSPWIGL